MLEYSTRVRYIISLTFMPHLLLPNTSDAKDPLEDNRLLVAENEKLQKASPDS